MKLTQPLRLVIFLLAFTLTACGSGSDDTPNSDPNSNTLTGRFVDSPVFGLSYATSSGLAGLTNDAGEFPYLDGDMVTFSLGPIDLGSILAAPKITPFDLAGFDLPSGDLELSDLVLELATIDSGTENEFRTGVNMLIFLQSLDRNNSPGDGIEIISSIGVFFFQQAFSLLFNQNTGDFLSAFFVLFTSLITNNLLDRELGDAPVERDDAIRHFLTSNI